MMNDRLSDSNQEESFPGWGAAGLPAGVILGVILGAVLGGYFGVPGIGAAIGAAIGVSGGMALLAAAVVTASTRSKR